VEEIKYIIIGVIIINSILFYWTEKPTKTTKKPPKSSEKPTIWYKIKR